MVFKEADAKLHFGVSR